MSRRRRRGAGLFLYVEDAVLGLRRMRPILFEDGERAVERRQFDHVRDDNHKLIGYVSCDGRKRPQPEPKSSNRTDPAAITANESRAYAGLMGKSRTVGLCEDQRKARVHSNTGRVMPAEDFVERAQNKVNSFAASANFRTGDRAVRVYPRSR